MATALSLLCLIAITGALAGWLKRPFELLLPAVVSGLMIIFWLAGYVVPIDWLRYPFWAAGALAIVLTYTMSGARLSHATTLGLGIFVLAVSLIALASRNLVLLSWDEFSHWGQVARFLAETGRYPSTGEILFDGYPFGTALLQVVLGGSSETNWIVIQSVLKVSALLPLLAYVSGRQKGLTLLLVAFAIGTQSFFVRMGGFTDILIDMPLALYAASSLTIYYRERNSIAGIALATVIAASLPLFKDIGLLLSAFISAVIVVDQLLQRVYGATLLLRVNGATMRTLPLLMSAGPVLGAALTHKIRMALLGPVAGFGFTLNWSTITNGVNHTGFGVRFTTTVENFGNALTGGILVKPGYALPTLLLMITGILIGAGVAAGRSWFRPAAFYLVSLTGLAAYLLFLLVLYIFAFTEYEGIRLASYARYVNTFIVMLLIASAALIPTARLPAMQRIVSVLPLTIVTIIMASSMKYFPREFNQQNNASLPRRMEVKAALAKAPSEVLNGARTYVVWNGTTGEQFYMTMYGLVPYRTNTGCFSIGAPRYDGDIWSCNITPEAFTSRIDGYQYMLLGRVDENFIDRFGGLFSSTPQPGWYRIQASTSRTVLIPCEASKSC